MPHDEFMQRYKARFADPNFASMQAHIDQLAETAWENYTNSRKAPNTRKAGPGYENPDYDLSIDWINAHNAITDAKKRHEDKHSGSRVLLVCAAARNDKTCPGEMSKTFRLVQIAKAALGK